jgi:undecaprenyl-diphosphatase
MGIVEALILGLIQGLTEFIPVSSSGHLLIAHEIIDSTGSTLSFDVALHVGTLLALLLYFRRDLIELLKNLTKNNDQGKLARLLILATIPAVIAGLLFSGYIDDNLRTPTVVAITLAGVGLIMLAVDLMASRKSDKQITTKQGMTVGIVQVVSLIPGVSRSGATITAGMFMGLSRSQAARFSFLLAIPIIAGSAFGVLFEQSDGLTTGNWQLAIGVVSAFVSGLIAIKFLLKVITKAGLKPFAIYRIVLAVFVLVFLV